MSGSQNRNDLVATRDTAAPAAGDASTTSAPAVVASNVVPFARMRREATPANDVVSPAFDPAHRPAPYWPRRDRRTVMLALLVLSLLVHGGLYFIFSRPPEPMVSIGVEAISVELVPGSNSVAGLAADPGQAEAQTAPPPAEEPKQETETAKAEDQPPPQETPPPEVAAEQKSEPVIAAEEPKPEPAVEAPPAAETPPEKQIAALPAEPTPPEPEPEIAVAPPEPKPVEPKPAAPPKVQAKPQPAPTHETRPKQPARARSDARQKSASREAEHPGPRANAASGAGPGRSQNYSNWIGTVYAHLARYQRRNQTNAGLVVVRFGLDASGRVTRVSLARSSGFADLDQEAQAAVRRASPFPAPPLGVSDVTAPIRYRPAS